MSIILEGVHEIYLAIMREVISGFDPKSSSNMDDEKILNLEVPLGRLKGIKFEMLTRSDIKLFSTMLVSESSHVTDASLGLPNLSSCCLTCGASSMKDCDGHFGYVELPADICHPHFIPELVLILNKICPGCKSLRSRKKAKVSAAEKLMKSELTDGSIGCKYCSVSQYTIFNRRHHVIPSSSKD